MGENKGYTIEKITSKVSIFSVLKALNIQWDYHYMCVCPIHKDINASMRIYKDGHFHCFACGAHGDVVELVKQIHNFSLKETFAWFDKNFELYKLNTKPTEIIAPKEKNKEEKMHFKNDKVVDYARECSKYAYMTNYFSMRGLNEKTVKMFNLGFDRLRNTVVIPYNKDFTYYQSRSVVNKKFYKVPDYMAGSEPLFNATVLKHSSIVFVVESPICAMSIKQCGGEAISLCGVCNVRKLVNYLTIHKYRGCLILCMDNDEAGKVATIDLQKNLKKLKIDNKIINIASDCKDPNELLVKNHLLLENNIQKAINIVRKGRQMKYGNKDTKQQTQKKVLC